jgi:hypothetical protein
MGKRFLLSSLVLGGWVAPAGAGAGCSWRQQSPAEGLGHAAAPDSIGVICVRPPDGAAVDIEAGRHSGAV